MKSRTVTLLLASVFALRADHEIGRLDEAKRVFEEIMQTPDKGIPQDLLAKGHCIVLIPGAKRGAFIAGAQYGVGFALCRQPDGTGWTAPSTVRIEGGSVGLQIGGGEVDIALLVMNEEGARELMKSEFTVGGDAAAMAGPVGRTVTAETDAYMHAKILSYSRSRGVFAGVALKGSTLRSDDDANRVIYGRSVRHEDILKGQVKAPPAAAGLISLLTSYSRRESNGAPSPATREKPSKPR
jgi:lipid-binding SYLF domain-containing protein